MARARRAASTALIVVALITALTGWSGAAVRAGAVAWPASTLVVSELQTGGASASDEFVEIANQGDVPADLLGLEVVYATSSGSTVTRKATWAAIARPRSGQAHLDRQWVRDVRGHCRRDLLERIRGHGRGDRPARGRRCRHRRGRLGRCDEQFRRGHRGCGSAGGFEPGAGTGWRGRQRDRHEPEQPRLVRPGGALAAGNRRLRRYRVPSRHRPDRTPTPTPDADADPPTPTPTPTADTDPTPTPTPTPTADSTRPRLRHRRRRRLRRPPRTRPRPTRRRHRLPSHLDRGCQGAS